MAYLLISILHQSVHQLNDLVRVGRVSTSRIGLREHGPILAAPYDGANSGIKLLLVLEGDVSFALGLSISKSALRSDHSAAVRRVRPPFLFNDEPDVAPAAPFIMRRALRI